MQRQPARLDELAKIVPMWNVAPSHVVYVMCGACRKLGFDPERLSGAHLAILASLFRVELATALG